MTKALLKRYAVMKSSDPFYENLYLIARFQKLRLLHRIANPFPLSAHLK
jgi:hypothetical protein